MTRGADGGRGEASGGEEEDGSGADPLTDVSPFSSDTTLYIHSTGSLVLLVVVLVQLSKDLSVAQRSSTPQRYVTTHSLGQIMYRMIMPI